MGMRNIWEVHTVYSWGMNVVQYRNKKEAEEAATRIIKGLKHDYKKTRQPNKIIITVFEVVSDEI